MRWMQLLGVVCWLGCFVNFAHAENKYVIVGTGGITGVYYPAGGSVCRIVNRLRESHGIRCTVESTEGEGTTTETSSATPTGVRTNET